MTSTTGTQLPCGLLNVNKPSGCTSRDVVNQVLRRAPRRAKAGHAGTLDPLADGVLVVCLGAATRLATFVQQCPKVYRALFLLGRTSDTEDVEGNVQWLPDARIPSAAEIDQAIRTQTGEVLQRPPAYSALRVGGRRAHELARRGKVVDLAPRPVTIHQIDLLRYDHPELELRIRCGAGTYVRSLGRDLAESVGTGAVMANLTREAIGDFSLADALSFDALDRDSLRERLQPPEAAVAHLPRVQLSDEALHRIAHGGLLSEGEVGVSQPEAAAVGRNGALAAVLRRAPVGWKPAVNLIGK